MSLAQFYREKTRLFKTPPSRSSANITDVLYSITDNERDKKKIIIEKTAVKGY